MSTSLSLDRLPALLTIHDIATLLRVRRTTAYARTRETDFPDPLVISGSCYRWYAHEVLAYVDSRRTPKRAHLRRSTGPAAGESLPTIIPPTAAKARRTTRPRRPTIGRR